MFHVPGWSVSSSSLQTQQAEKKSTTGSKDTEPSSNGVEPASTARPSKKRKRGGQGRNSATNVTADNLVTLWEKHIEGKAASHGNTPSNNRLSADPTKADKKSTKEQKRGKIENEFGKAGSDPNTNATATLQAAKDKFERRKLSKQERHEAQAAGLLPPSRTLAASAPSTQSQTPSAPTPPPPPPPPQPTQSVTKLTPLQASMRQKLISARFRHLNQTLYTSPSAQSLSLFAENPQMFNEYHEGFRKQVEVWPENPVDGYIQAIRERGRKRFESQKGRFRKEKNSSQNPHDRPDEAQQQDESSIPPLPRTDGLCTIADLGCGDAKLARTLTPDAKKLHLRLLSYDLQSPHPLVTRVDMAHVPLASGSVDVAIFCLALMGTNWIDFVEEAYRLLRWRGELWVAEIKSRFGRVQGRAAAAAGQKPAERGVGKKKKTGANSKGKGNAQAAADDDNADAVDVDLLREIDGPHPASARLQDTDTAAFVEVLRKRGFALKDGMGAVDRSNKMFVKMEFVKALSPSRGKGVPIAHPRDAGRADGGQGKWRPKTRFIDRVEDVVDGEGEGDEAGVLKPCVYKLR